MNSHWLQLSSGMPAPRCTTYLNFTIYGNDDCWTGRTVARTRRLFLQGEGLQVNMDFAAGLCVHRGLS